MDHRIRERTRELEAGLRLANEANTAKTEFLSNISHELRTPLNGILGMTQMLEKRLIGDLNEKQAEYVADILTSGRHLLSLIDDILDLSQIESGNVQLSVEEIGLEAFLAGVMKVFQTTAMKKRIRMNAVLAPSIPGLKIMGDNRLLKQVLFNLISNAIKFTPAGGTVTLSAERHDGRVSS